MEEGNLTDEQIGTLIDKMGSFKKALTEQASAAGVAADDQSLLNLAMGDSEAVSESASDAYMAQADVVEDLKSQLMELIDTINAANGVGQDAVSQNIRYQETLEGVRQAIADGASGLDAVMELGRILGGQAVVNSRGAWVIIPDVIGAPVASLRLGDLGTVLEVADEIETDTVFNEVVGSFEDSAGNPLYAVARVTSGPLSVSGPYGTNTRYYSSDLVKTQQQADRAVASVLSQSIGSQQYDVRIQCHINPLIEVGDVVELTGWRRPLVGRLMSVEMSDSPYMNVTLRVDRELS